MRERGRERVSSAQPMVWWRWSPPTPLPCGGGKGSPLDRPVGWSDIDLFYFWKRTVIKAFGGLVTFCAIAGNITSGSREIYASLKSNPCYCTVFSQLYVAGFCSSFVFPAIAGIFPRFNLWFVPGSTFVLSQVQPGNCPSFLWYRREHFLSKRRVNQCFYSVVIKVPACNLQFPLRKILFCFTTVQLQQFTTVCLYISYLNIMIIFTIKLISSNLGIFPAIAGNCTRFSWKTSYITDF